MTVQELMSVKGMRPALLALVVGAGLCTWTWRRAMALDETPPAGGPVTIVPGALDPPSQVDNVDVAAAVASGIFSQERRAPVRRYWLAGQPLPPLPPAVPVVLGVVLGDSGSSFCACRLDSDRLYFPRVGDVVGTYTVKSIALSGVTFITKAGKELTIPTAKRGS